MMRRLFVLWRKELSAQVWVLSGAGAILLLLALIQWLAARGDPTTTSYVEVAHAVIVFSVPLFGLVLGHRVVVREYQAHTQLFLEALPLRRSELVLGKYLFGLLVLCGPASAFAWSIALASGETAPTFYGILALRASGFAAALWTVFFSLGLLGRLRISAYLSLAFGLFLLTRTTGFEPTRFGPLALISADDFAYEREVVPVRALIESALMSALFLLVAFGVALTHEGSLAERLTRRASAREVVAVTVLLVSELMAALWVQSKSEAAPFEFTSGMVSRSRSGGVQVMYGYPELEPYANVLVRALHDLAARLSSELGVERVPPVRVAHNPLLSPGEVRSRSAAAKMDSVLMEVNVGLPRPDLHALLEHTAHAFFFQLSQKRAAFEPNHWLLDGFSSSWAAERVPLAYEREWLRGLVAARRLPATPAALTDWEPRMEQLGTIGANALAFTVLEVLKDRHGRERVLSLARDVLAKPTVTDGITWLRQRHLGLERRFESVTHEPWPEFVAHWRGELRRQVSAGPRAERLAQIPNDTASVRLEPSRVGADIVYRFSGPELPRHRECAILYLKTLPYDAPVPTEWMKRTPVRWDAREARVEGRVKGAFQNGDLALLAQECFVPELEGPVRLNAVRLEAP